MEAFAVLRGLGEAIKKSGRLALARRRRVHAAFASPISGDRTSSRCQSFDIYLHLPQGAVKKDGSSAGAAMVSA